MSPTIYCTPDMDVWFGLKSEFKNKHTFAEEVKDLSDCDYPKTSLLRNTGQAHFKYSDCDCGCGSEHVELANSGMKGYILDLGRME